MRRHHTRTPALDDRPPRRRPCATATRPFAHPAPTLGSVSVASISLRTEARLGVQDVFCRLARLGLGLLLLGDQGRERVPRHLGERLERGILKVEVLQEAEARSAGAWATERKALVVCEETCDFS